MKNLINSKTGKAIYSIAGLVMIVSIMFLVFSHSKISASNENAKIVFTEESHDFGKVEQGPVLEYSFKFTNEGDKPLVIESVQPACGCTGATFGDKTEYAEGERGEIKITFNTQGRTGHQEKHVTVMTNDTENPKKDLKFMCDIEEVVLKNSN